MVHHTSKLKPNDFKCVKNRWKNAGRKKRRGCIKMVSAMPRSWVCDFIWDRTNKKTWNAFPPSNIAVLMFQFQNMIYFLKICLNALNACVCSMFIQVWFFLLYIRWIEQQTIASNLNLLPLTKSFKILLIWILDGEYLE